MPPVGRGRKRVPSEPITVSPHRSGRDQSAAPSAEKARVAQGQPPAYTAPAASTTGSPKEPALLWQFAPEDGSLLNVCGPAIGKDGTLYASFDLPDPHHPDRWAKRPRSEDPPTARARTHRRELHRPRALHRRTPRPRTPPPRTR